MKLSKQEKAILLIFLVSFTSFAILVGLALTDVISNTNNTGQFSGFLVIPASFFFIGCGWSMLLLFKKNKFWKR